MLGSNKGEFIDRFDIICRSLGSSGHLLDNPKDLGSRTDVLFVNAKVASLHKPLDVIHLKKQGVRSVVFRERIPLEIGYLIDNGIEVNSCLDLKIFGLGTVPMMALLATQWLLERDAQTVFISGCDFYASYRNNRKINLASWMSGYQAEWDNEPPSSSHDIECHFQWFFKKLYSCEVFCDDIFAQEINKWWKEKTRKQTDLK